MTSGDRSVAVVCSRTQVTEILLVIFKGTRWEESKICSCLVPILEKSVFNTSKVKIFVNCKLSHSCIRLSLYTFLTRWQRPLSLLPKVLPMNLAQPRMDCTYVLLEVFPQRKSTSIELGCPILSQNYTRRERSSRNRPAVRKYCEDPLFGPVPIFVQYGLRFTTTLVAIKKKVSQ
jgi:hypothetical protein